MCAPAKLNNFSHSSYCIVWHNLLGAPYLTSLAICDLCVFLRRSSKEKKLEKGEPLSDNENKK